MLELTVIGLLTAFFAGIASFLSPCVLPLVPGYLSYIAGGSVQLDTSHIEARAARWRALGLSACFVAGFSMVFLILGASITAIGRLRSEEHTSELQSLMRISYAVFCLKKKKKIDTNT